MDMALVATRPGGSGVMEWTALETGMPGDGEVLVRHTAIGVNFIDVYFRSGLYPWAEDTMIPGAEAAGVVEEIGPGVSDLKPGDRVAYVMRTGAYRQRRIMPAERLVKLPDGISEKLAASVMLKGLTAQYLVTASHVVKPGETVLVHAAAGGVGLILGQWLKALGARAIGTAGSEEKVALALSHGYSDVINYRTEDFAAKVMELTDGKGCEAVYDSVGKDTWRGSLAVLKRFGMFVNFGQSSGMIEGFKLSDLARGSLSANRPMLFDYVATRADLEMRADDLFGKLKSGAVKADVITEMPLQEAGAAHDALETRKTRGSLVLTV
ncbi:quinone oxidoreductase [Martelella alba]|uniref:Quinone oxidoreductase n=1 Tax=Martelella alba TaxID=2590451 RepID=A0A506U3T0_9HYPH|nr:quinone oxidoreductase [Martelella alba]TPW28490.1 quinone oxidoreductase [Martelella alba]